MTIERWLHVVALRCRSLFRRRHVDNDLDDEIRHHIELVVEDHVAKGMDAAAARDLAARQLGRADLVKERCRDARGTQHADTIVLDVRYALRTLVASRSPPSPSRHRARHRRQRRRVQPRRRRALVPLPCRCRRLVSAGVPAGPLRRCAIGSVTRRRRYASHAFTLSGEGSRCASRARCLSRLMPLLGVKPALGR